MKHSLLAALLLLLPGPASGQPAHALVPAARPAAPVATAPARAAQPQGEPRPAIWLLSDADTRIYIFGTVHALRPGLRWRSAAFNRIAREAQELVLEANATEITGLKFDFATIMQMGKSVPILQRVSPDRRAALARLLTELEVPEGGLDTFHTWGVATIIGLAQVTRNWGESSAMTEASAASGVETVLIREFRDSSRPISGAESPTEALGGFRSMTLSEQRAMLDEAIDAYVANAPTGEPYETSWITGDVERLAATVETFPPYLYDILITRRNRGFADWLARRLDQPGTVLFAIGAGHLAGRVSVQSMLESRGLRVQRIY